MQLPFYLRDSRLGWTPSKAETDSRPHRRALYSPPTRTANLGTEGPDDLLRLNFRSGRQSHESKMIFVYANLGAPRNSGSDTHRPAAQDPVAPCRRVENAILLSILPPSFETPEPRNHILCGSIRSPSFGNRGRTHGRHEKSRCGTVVRTPHLGITRSVRDRRQILITFIELDLLDGKPRGLGAFDCHRPTARYNSLRLSCERGRPHSTHQKWPGGSW